VQHIRDRTSLNAYEFLSDEEVTALIKAEVLHTKVHREDKITSESRKTFEELEKDGLIFMSPAPISGYHVISIPYFTFPLLKTETKFSTVIPKLLRTDSTTLSPRANEIQDLELILLKLDLLSRSSDKKKNYIQIE